jgi:hypothetical protein
VSGDQLTDDEPFLAPQVAEPLTAALGPLRGGRDGTFLCHNQCALGAIPLLDVLRTALEFLKENPDEVTASSSRTRSAPDRATAAGVNGHDVIVEGPAPASENGA